MAYLPRPRRLGFLSVLLAMFSGLLPADLHAQGAKPLPGYVIDRFGTPPAIKDALRVVFVDSLDRLMREAEQIRAFTDIAASADPRLASIISDMMRSTWRDAFDTAVANTAAILMGIDLRTHLRWREMTNHLIAPDIPAYSGISG